MNGEYLSVIISACMLVIAFITYNRGTRKMDGEQVSNMAFLKNELEHIKSDLSDIKDSISEIKKGSNSMEVELSQIKEQITTLFKRVEALEDRNKNGY
jgi:peptidoglycan hydrolase CwlO-like protein